MPRTRHQAASAAFAALLLGGCACYQAQPLSAAHEAAKFRSRSLAEVAGAARLRGRAWNCEALTRAALLLHPEMELARAQWKVAHAGILTAGAHPNPTLGFDGQLTGNMLGGMSPWSLGFSLDIPVETAGKRGHRIAQATAAAQAAALQMAVTEAQIHSRVRRSLVELSAATARAGLLTREQQTQSLTLKALEERVAAGEISRPELIPSRLLYNQSQLLLRDAERQQNEAQAAVADAVGISAAAMAGATLNLDEFSHPPADLSTGRLRRALEDRPDVLASLAEYAASEAALRLEIARQYPDFHFNPGYLWDQGQNKWFITPTVELPVFDQHRGPIAEAEAKRKAAAAKVHVLQARASGEIDLALAGYRGALKKLKTAEALLADQEKQKQSAETLLKSGESDRLAVLSAQVEFDSTALARLDALVEVQRAFGALEDAAAGGGVAK